MKYKKFQILYEGFNIKEHMTSKPLVTNHWR